MIGRGTRLCPDLFGSGCHKTVFRIFDHWGNFEYFEQDKPDVEPALSKSLMQRLFEARIDLAETALNKSELAIFNDAVELIAQDMNSLPEQTIAVREKWKEKRSVSKPEVLNQFAPATVQMLRREMAPLMQWVNLPGHLDAYLFDLLLARMQIELLKRSGVLDDLRDECLARVAELIMHLNPVRARAETIKLVNSPAFWESPTVAGLEQVRQELRGIMHHRAKQTGPNGLPPRTVDVEDGGIEFTQRRTNLREVDMIAYRRRVEEALRNLFDKNPTLAKIRSGQTVSDADLNALASLILTQNPGVNLELLKEFYAETAAPLDFLIRSIIGMDAEAVKQRFETFVHRYPQLSSTQIRFLSMLENHISKYGSIELGRLYEAPFTTVHSDGLDGVFRDERQIEDILGIIQTFQPPAGP
jgi:type I restriction enzyme R subunit